MLQNIVYKVQTNACIILEKRGMQQSLTTNHDNEN